MDGHLRRARYARVVVRGARSVAFLEPVERSRPLTVMKTLPRCPRSRRVAWTTVWLPLRVAVWYVAVVGALGVVGTLSIAPARRPRWLISARPVLHESVVLMAIYAVWLRLGQVDLMGSSGAIARGRWLWDVERALHLPDEATIEHWLTHVSVLLRFANVYYIVAHVAPLGAFLVWLFIRRRDRFAYWRNVLAFVSFTCAMLQWIAVAPPRMFPEYGFFDAGARYGPTVYSGSDLSGQFAAMPSMHVCWALVVGVGVVCAGRSRWRWLALLHPLLTIYAVTVTGYHWLLDSVVAGVLLLAAVGAGELVRTATLRRSRVQDHESVADGELATLVLDGNGDRVGAERSSTNRDA